MAKHAAEVVEKLTTQVEEMKAKIMQLDDLKAAQVSIQATLEQMQSSTQGMFQQMMLQMQTLATSVSAKMGNSPKPEVSATDKPSEVMVPPITTIVTAATEKKGSYFPFVVEVLKFGSSKLRGTSLSMILVRTIA